MKWKRAGDCLTVYLGGEIDHCASKSLREQIDKLLANPQTKRLVFDFADVSFMDSSGIGMLIGRYKMMQERSGLVFARALTPEVKPIFMMAGLHRIINLESERRDEA